MYSPASAEKKPLVKGVYELRKTKPKVNKSSSKVTKPKTRTKETGIKQSRINLYPSKYGRVSRLFFNFIEQEC